MSGPNRQRERYHPTGVMKWSRLPLLIAGPLAAAVPCAMAMNWLYERGWYLIFIVPAVFGLLLGGVISLLIWWSHFRRPFLAGIMGLVLGVVGYIGVYYAGLSSMMAQFRVPISHAQRLQMLPDYIVFRMHSDVTTNARKADNPNDPNAKRKEPDVVLNWLMFLFEMGFFAWLTAKFSWDRARRAYCPELGKWMSCASINVAPELGRQLMAALDEGDMERFIELPKTPQANEKALSTCSVEYAHAPDASPLTFPVYLTVREHGYLEQLFPPLMLLRVRLYQVSLDVQETLKLRSLFPGLESALAVVHRELRDIPRGEERDPWESKNIVHFEPLPEANQVAKIVPIPEPYRGRVYNRPHLWISGSLALLPLLVPLGGVGLIGWEAFRVHVGADWLPAIVLGLVGVAGVAFGWFYIMWYPTLLEVSFSRWCMLRAIRLRPDPFVDVDDPDLVVVGISARENWTQFKLEMADDVGFLKLDQQRGQLLFEGDFERFQIPVGALTECAAECFCRTLDRNLEQRNECWMMRLVARIPDGTREILLLPGHSDFMPRNNTIRRQIATLLCQRIRALGPARG